MAQHPPFFRWGLACAAECDGRALDRILPVLSVARKGVAELGASGLVRDCNNYFTFTQQLLADISKFKAGHRLPSLAVDNGETCLLNHCQGAQSSPRKCLWCRHSSPFFAMLPVRESCDLTLQLKCHELCFMTWHMPLPAVSCPKGIQRSLCHEFSCVVPYSVLHSFTVCEIVKELNFESYAPGNGPLAGNVKFTCGSYSWNVLGRC